MTKLKTPHDRLFHFAFQDPEVARAELRAVLPPELLARLDLSTLEPVRDRLVDAKLANLFTDVVYRVKLAGEDALIWALLEHQSTPDGLMPLRVLQYKVGIWSAYVLDDERRARGKLPVIIPVVITHGRAATAPRSILDLLDASPEVVRIVRPLYPEVAYLVDDLMSFDEATLEARSASPLYGLVTAMLKTRGEGRPERFDAYRQALAALARTRNWAAVRALMEYVCAVATSEKPIILEAAKAADPELEEHVTTYAERLEQRGRERGHAEGRQEGRKEGRRKGRLEGRKAGQTALLLKQLALRFGPVPPDVAERVHDGSEAEHEQWALRLLEADSLADVFAPAS